MGVMLEVEDLTVGYGNAIAIQGIGLAVDQGDCVAVIGPNGAGKTSLLRAVSGFLGREQGQIAAGVVRFRDRPINGMPPYRVARLGVALVPERDKVFPSLTVEEQLGLARAVVGRRRYEEERARVLDLFDGLRKHLKRPAGYLSGGERQMLSLGAALCTAPSLLVIDELSQGLAPGIIQALVERLREVNAAGMTMLIVEQAVHVAVDLAERIYVLDAGRMVTSQPASEIRGREDLHETYLGVRG